jgi:hypothetical protein
MADDFTIPAGGNWSIDEIVFYAYQTGAPTTSTITEVNLRIWDGEPGNGGTVIWGDNTTNIMVNTMWSGIYRVSETTTGVATDRAIMANTVNVGGLSLPPGTYWLDWQSNGTLGSGPWAPPININGQAVTGNGLQSLADNGATWGPANDGGTGAPQQGLPFLIMGNSGCTASDIPWVSVAPDSGTTSGGNSTDVTVTFDSTGLTIGNTYTGTLCVNSNDAANPIVTVPLTLTVEAPSYGVELDPDGALTDLAGATVTYTLYITNTGNAADTFDLAATGNSWTTTLSDSSVSLNVGESTMVWVTVEIPTGVADGDMDVATVTATSAGDSGVSASATLTTTAEVPEPEGYFIYLPFVARSDA